MTTKFIRILWEWLKDGSLYNNILKCCTYCKFMDNLKILILSVAKSVCTLQPCSSYTCYYIVDMTWYHFTKCFLVTNIHLCSPQISFLSLWKSCKQKVAYVMIYPLKLAHVHSLTLSDSYIVDAMCFEWFVFAILSFSGLQHVTYTANGYVTYYNEKSWKYFNKSLPASTTVWVY